MFPTWKIICWFWSGGKICLAKEEVNSDWTLSRVHMQRPFQDLSTRTAQMQITNTSWYSLCSCLITDNWFGNQRWKAKRVERKNWKTKSGRGNEERDCCNWSFPETAVRKDLAFYPERYCLCCYQRQKECNGEQCDGRGADNCIQYLHSTIILTVKLNSSPANHFNNHLFFGTCRWKTFFFHLVWWTGKKWQYHLLGYSYYSS